MTATELLKTASVEGVTLSLSKNGEMKIVGGRTVIQILSPGIRAHKAELIKMLSCRKISPGCCQGCERLEIINIMSESVPGCLYRAEGEFPEGWRRLPEQLEKCLWN